MVKSGIVNDVKVSHFRLATHLLVALFTLGGLVWTALDLKTHARGEAPARLTGFAILTLGTLLFQLLIDKVVPHQAWQTLTVVVGVFIMLAVFPALATGLPEWLYG